MLPLAGISTRPTGAWRRDQVASRGRPSPIRYNPSVTPHPRAVVNGWMNPLRQLWAATPFPLRYGPKVFGRTLRLYYEDDCGTYAAAIAYHALFSLVPLALVTLSVLGLIVNQDRIVDFVYDQVPLQESESVQENVDQIVRQARGISIAGLSFGFILLAWSGTAIFSAVRKGLNATYSSRQGRSYITGKLIDVLLIFAFGLLVLVSVAATALVQIVVERVDMTGVDFTTGLKLGTGAATAAVTFLLFVMLYRYVPTLRPRWVEAIPGALFATVLFEALKNIAALLLAKAPFTTNTAIYAGFSTAFAFLFWMYLNASILLLGAEFGRASRSIRQEEQRRRAERHARAYQRKVAAERSHAERGG